MKFNTNTTLSMLACAGLLTAASSASAFQPLGGAYAEGDILVGFTVGSGNDLIANLGPASTALVNGNQWDFSGLLTNVVSGGDLTGISWGVVGSINGPNRVYSTSASKPNTFAGQTAFNQVNTAVNGLGGDLNGTSGYGTPAANAPGNSSWYNGTVVGSSSTTFKLAYGNPNVTPATFPSTANFFTTTSGTSTTNVVQTGSFTLSATGILSFSTVISTTPPPSKIVSITRLGNVSTVIFTTTNGSFTYSLHYTNSAGLSSPRSTWPAVTTTVTGTGVTNSINDTTTDPNRFYSVGVH